jgi:hypothetical protein
MLLKTDLPIVSKPSRGGTVDWPLPSVCTLRFFYKNKNFLTSSGLKKHPAGTRIPIFCCGLFIDYIADYEIRYAEAVCK